MAVVDEMDGVVNGDTQYHRDERSGHHVERIVEPAHHAAHDDSRGDIGYHAHESHLPVAEDKHEDNADDQHREQHRPHLPALYILLHDGELGNVRSEEHTSELQSRQYLVCRLLLE